MQEPSVTQEKNPGSGASWKIRNASRKKLSSVYTLLYLKCITNNDLLYGIESSDSMLRGKLDGRGVWGRMDTCVCVAESLCCPSETITTLSVGYIPI